MAVRSIAASSLRSDSNHVLNMQNCCFTKLKSDCVLFLTIGAALFGIPSFVSDGTLIADQTDRPDRRHQIVAIGLRSDCDRTAIGLRSNWHHQMSAFNCYHLIGANNSRHSSDLFKRKQLLSRMRLWDDTVQQNVVHLSIKRSKISWIKIRISKNSLNSSDFGKELRNSKKEFQITSRVGGTGSVPLQ